MSCWLVHFKCTFQGVNFCNHALCGKYFSSLSQFIVPSYFIIYAAPHILIGYDVKKIGTAMQVYKEKLVKEESNIPSYRMKMLHA